VPTVGAVAAGDALITTLADNTDIQLPFDTL
jgi:hypothetical protein